MDKVIVLKNDDGSCHIVHPAPAMFDVNSRDRLMLAEEGRLAIDAYDDEIMDFILHRSNDDKKHYRFMSIDNLPKDRHFRNAWTDDLPGEQIDIHIGKAQEIQRNHWREMRKPLLEALDVQFMRAIESGDQNTIKEIATKKQELRDVTKLDMPTDQEVLKAFIPACLTD